MQHYGTAVLTRLEEYCTSEVLPCVHPLGPHLWWAGVCSACLSTLKYSPLSWVNPSAPLRRRPAHPDIGVYVLLYGRAESQERC